MQKFAIKLQSHQLRLSPNSTEHFASVPLHALSTAKIRDGGLLGLGLPSLLRLEPLSLHDVPQLAQVGLSDGVVRFELKGS